MEPTKYKKPIPWRLIIMLAALIFIAIYCCSCSKPQPVTPINSKATYVLVVKSGSIYSDSYLICAGKTIYFDTNLQQQRNDTITFPAILHMHCKGKVNEWRNAGWAEFKPIISPGGSVDWYDIHDTTFTYTIN